MSKFAVNTEGTQSAATASMPTMVEKQTYLRL